MTSTRDGAAITSTTGPGELILTGAGPEFEEFAKERSNLAPLYYAIVARGSDQWETGLGAWNTSGTLTRRAENVLAGSAGAGILVDFQGGIKDVYIQSKMDQVKDWIVDTQPDVVFSIGGQSNADGRGQPLPTTQPARNSTSYLYSRDNTIVVSSEPAGVAGALWVDNRPEGSDTPVGEGYSFLTDLGRGVRALTGQSCLLVPNAIGGTGMLQWAPPTVEGDLKSLFGAFVTRTRRAVALTKNHNPPVFVWFGHEVDSASVTEDLATGVIGNGYTTRWKDLTDDIRSRFPDSPILFAQLCGDDGDTFATRLRRAGESQRLSESTLDPSEALGESIIANTHMAVSFDVPRNADPDGLHVSAEGQAVMGLRFARLYAERVLGFTWINGTGPRLVSVTNPTSTTVLVTTDSDLKEDTNGYGVDLANSLFRVYDDGVEVALSSVVRDSSNAKAILITTTPTLTGVVVVTYGERVGPDDATWRQGVVYDNDNMPLPMFGPVVAS